MRVRGPYSAEGYFNDPAQSQTSFRDGWFYPGDYGSLTLDGMLVNSGREKAIIDLGGDKLKPEMVEEVIKSHGAVEEAGVFSIINELGIEQLWSVGVPRGRGARKGCGRLRNHTAARLHPGSLLGGGWNSAERDGRDRTPQRPDMAGEGRCAPGRRAEPSS